MSQGQRHGRQRWIGGDMLKALGSRLTYANVVATGALFVALGGGAYALSGVPDRSGIYHGCVATSGALRVVAKASSCRKTRTVTRGSRRVRIPGESAIAWNQQGQQGVQGIQGQNGEPGTARAFATMRPDECFGTNGECTIYNVKNIASIRRKSAGT